MSDRISAGDIFDADFYIPIINGVDKITERFKLLETQQRENLVSQRDFLAGLKVSNFADLQKLIATFEQLNKTVKEYETTTKEAAAGEKESERLKQEQIKTAKLQEQLVREQIKTQNASNKTKEKTLSLYQEESKKLRDLKNEYYNVALAQGQSSKAAQDLLAKLTPLDAKLKAINKSAGDNFREVGNYGKALDGLKSSALNTLGALGIGFGASEVVGFFKDSIRLSSEFEASLKNLQAITGASALDLEFYSKNAKELGVSVDGGAKAVVEAYKLIGSAKPELLANKEALNQVTMAAITLSKAGSITLPDAATRLTDALNQFGAPAEQAGKYIDVLAAGAKAGAAEIPDITDALLKFGVAAKSSNINVQESVGAIELLAEKGLKGAEAGTQLRNVFAKLSATKILPKEARAELIEAGVNLEKLQDKTIPLQARLQELSKIQGNAAAITKTFGLENKAAGEILISNLPRLQELTKLVDENGVAVKQAKINTDTFKQSLLESGNAFDNLKISVGNSESGLFKTIVDGFTNVEVAAATYINTLNEIDSTLKKVGQSQTFYQKYISSTLNLASFGTIGEDSNTRLLSIQQRVDLIKQYAQVTKDYQQADDEYKKLLFAINNSTDSDELKNQVRALINEGRKKTLAELRAKTAADKKGTVVAPEVVTGGGGGLTDAESDKKSDKNFKKYKEDQQKIIDQNAEDDVVIVDQKKETAARLEEIEAARVAYELNLSALEAQKKIDDEKLAAEERKKIREKEIKEAVDVAQKTLSILDKNLQDKEKKRQDASDKEVAGIQSSIDEQKRRAEQGLTNTLALEESKLAAAERKKEDESKKAIKREKTLAFFKLLAANAEKDPNTALQKTLVETFAAEAIAGSFFVGTERVKDDLQGNKVHAGRDGYQIRVDGEERILTGEENNLVGDMSNKELAALAYDFNHGKLLPDIALHGYAPAKSTQDIYGSMQLNQLVSISNELKGVKQEIMNKPVSQFGFNSFGELTEKRIEKGIEKRITQRRNRI